MSSSLTALLLFLPLQAPPPLPGDFAVLPEVSYRGATGITFHDTAPVTAMQRSCRFPSIRRGWRGVRVRSALLVSPDGRLLEVVPEPGVCPPLRNYVVRLYRTRLPGRLAHSGGDGPSWYRATITFSWQE